MKWPLAALGALALAACGDSGDAASRETAAAPAPPPPPCESASFEGVPLTHCIADPARHRITLVLGPRGGAPYRSLSELAVGRPSGAPPVAFAMNGGMFDEAGQPIGYYVENGKRLHKLNRNEGAGNFHLLPNGVFYGTGGQWAVRTAGDFAAHVFRRPEFGTQSGPMLVIAGKLHPKIDPDGASLKLRNGVGVDRQGRAHFVISDAPVSFGKLARYFRDELKTPNALFLDGSVSSLWNPELGRIDGGPPLGPLIVVEKRAKGAAAKDAP
ncbi:phosphodiester glycosidase family protein [Novosphingobium album (ex Liu et al. 2023)]|uniref:Phosphodiester glycosidase family protein n=1 Tax=Novosphingobium album (ex Liu et al. 2023) TaxID=3031130 RepID=A0ABT5WWG3_9SPHN|nr:phosphodiester glycosidase family protein [Novosphingobium album (ex Liu et al. 2023)]MDE8654194.1 phosphodiester glycosidase family protein [Novosphingobium album (ex Liu et al. 2023)]